MSKNPIIVFEGIEGTGKSHHIKKVANYLTRKKIANIQKEFLLGAINQQNDYAKIIQPKSITKNESIICWNY